MEKIIFNFTSFIFECLFNHCCWWALVGNLDNGNSLCRHNIGQMQTTITFCGRGFLIQAGDFEHFPTTGLMKNIWAHGWNCSNLLLRRLGEIKKNNFEKGGSKVRVLGQGGTCNSVPNGPNDLKFCMQGAFVCYYWVLVQSSSCNLYNGQACSGLQMWLASIEVTWPWLDQNSIVTHKSPLHAKFQVIWSFGGWVTGTPLSENPDFAPSPFW